MDVGPTTEFKRYQFSITLTEPEAREMRDWLYSDGSVRTPEPIRELYKKLEEIAE